jgi:hypothetical protein
LGFTANCAVAKSCAFSATGGDTNVFCHCLV